VSLIARNIASRAGNISFEIDAAGTNATFDVISMSTLDYDFDLVTSEDQLTYLAAIPGAMTITAVDKLSNMGSMFTVIETGIGDYQNKEWYTVLTSNVNMVLYSRTNSLNTYRFPFTIRYQDVRLDERSGHISLQMSPRYTNYTMFKWGQERSSIYAATNIPIFDKTANRIYGDGSNTVLAGDFIYDVVSQYYTGPSNSNIYNSASNIGNSGPLELMGGNEQIQTFNGVAYGMFPRLAEIKAYDYGTIVPNLQFDPAKTSDYDGVTTFELVRRLAAMEGAIFGSAFSVNFYINRTSNANNVTISNNDIIDLSFEPVPRSISSVDIKYGVGGTSQTVNAALNPISMRNATYIAWQDAPQKLTLNHINLTPFLTYGHLETNITYANGRSNSAIFRPGLTFSEEFDAYVTNINKVALSAYGPALGLTQSEAAVYTIELSLIGAEKIRPYHAFQFDTSVPTRYQNKMYRPSSISYDFMRDTVSLRAYEIGVGTSPEPVTTTAGPTTTSTTTTSGPTTTTTSTTSTTSTTTQGLTEFNTLRQSSVDGPTACTETPGTVTIWANNSIFCNATLFYASNNTGDPFIGNNNFYSDGTCWRQINNSGAIVSQGNCVTTTTTSTTSTTSTTTAAPTTTTTSTSTTTSTTTTSTTTTTTSTTTQPPCPVPTLNSISHVSGGTFSVSFTASGVNNCDGMKVQWSSDNATWSPAFGESMDCTSPNNVDTGLTSGTVYIRIAQQCTTPNEQSEYTASQSYTFPTTTTTTTTTIGGLTQFDNVWISTMSAADACSGGGASGPFTIWGNNATFKLCTQFYDDAGGTDPTIGGADWYAHRPSNQYARISNSGTITNNDAADCPATTTTTTTTTSAPTTTTTTTTTTSTTTTTTLAGLTAFTNVFESATSKANACAGIGDGPKTIYGNNAVFKLCTQFYQNTIGTVYPGGGNWYADNTSQQFARIANNGQILNNDPNNIGDC
jgi:hypothetical protein